MTQSQKKQSTVATAFTSLKNFKLQKFIERKYSQLSINKQIETAVIENIRGKERDGEKSADIIALKSHQ